MARYRTKDPVDLAWNEIRRRITTEVDLIVRKEREKVLNTLLGSAFGKFSESLTKGETLELEPGDEQFIRAKIEEALNGATVGLLSYEAP